jgi:polyisoprenoid-binding protein YceI
MREDNMKKLFVKFFVAATTMALSAGLWAADYKIDTEGAHAFIEFKIKHLGYSWLVGRFNQFDGEFSYDEKNPSAASLNVTIDTTSIDSNHAERDKHLRGDNFLNVGKFPQAKFVSESFNDFGNGKAKLIGKLTLHGVTNTVAIDVNHIGQGKDPWGGYRSGFDGKTSIKLKDFGYDFDLGPASTEVELYLGVEGIQQ